MDEKTLRDSLVGICEVLKRIEQRQFDLDRCILRLEKHTPAVKLDNPALIDVPEAIVHAHGQVLIAIDQIIRKL